MALNLQTGAIPVETFKPAEPGCLTSRCRQQPWPYRKTKVCMPVPVYLPAHWGMQYLNLCVHSHWPHSVPLTGSTQPRQTVFSTRIGYPPLRI
jgi:hypothetical protein